MKTLRYLISVAILSSSLAFAGMTQAADLVYPLSIAQQDSQRVYVADRKLPGIWQLEGNRLDVLYQGSCVSGKGLGTIRCVAVDQDGSVLLGDSGTRDVYRVDSAGKPQPLTSQNGSFGQIGIPMDIVVDQNGDLLVSDLESQRIFRVPKGGGDSTELAVVPGPRGLFYDDQQRLWIVSKRRLLRRSTEGDLETIVDDGLFQMPHAVVVDKNEIAYVSDSYAKAIWKVIPGNAPEKWLVGMPLIGPVGLEIVDDRILVADPQAKAIFEVDQDGKVSILHGGSNE